MEPTSDLNTNLSITILSMDINKNCITWLNQIEECIEKNKSTILSNDTKVPMAKCLQLYAKNNNCNVSFGIKCQCNHMTEWVKPNR